MSLPRHRGRFGAEQARRLLWRAGFGPRPGQAERLARLGLDGAVHALTRPASMRLVGPKPHDGDGLPLAPRDAWGHDHCWWLDRMVRTQAPLVERMTLVWHDWFATSKSGSTQGLMLRQNTMLRRHWLGRFDQLALDVTRDPAMLLWLNGVSARDPPGRRLELARAAGSGSLHALLLAPGPRASGHAGRASRALTQG